MMRPCCQSDGSRIVSRSAATALFLVVRTCFEIDKIAREASPILPLPRAGEGWGEGNSNFKTRSKIQKAIPQGVTMTGSMQGREERMVSLKPSMRVAMVFIALRKGAIG